MSATQRSISGISLGLVGAALLGGGLPPATAQDTSISDQIVVTGEIPMRNRTESVSPELTYGLDFFQHFEPISVGDMLKRVPGVGFTSDIGEYESPQLRGMGGGFTQILINGKPVPDSGGEDAVDRSVLVDRIPSELIDRIEVVRSPSADIDSQGVGGTINIILKNGATLPPGGSVRGSLLHYVPEIEGGEYGAGGFSYAGRSNDERLTYSVTGNIQQRFNPKFVVQEVYTSDRGSLADAIDLFAKNGANSVITDDEERTVENDVRKNLDMSLHADADYRLSDVTRLALTGFYINTDREERQDTLVFEDAPDNLVGLEGEDTTFDQENWGIQGEIIHDFSDTVTFTLLGSYATFDNTVESTALEIDAEDVSGELPTEESFLDNPSLEAFGLEADELEITDSQDDEYRIEGDVAVDLRSFAEQMGMHGMKLKLGIQSKFKSRDTTQLVAEFDDGELEEPEPGANGGIFEIGEDRLDGFIMSEMELTDRVTLEAGVRVEHTWSEQTGLEDGAARSRSTEETEVNPSAHLRWEVLDWATLRGSYARTVRRPNFNQRIPFAQFDDPDDDDVTRGNSGLETETAQGIDLGVEFTLPAQGIAGFNFFYRDISNLIQLVRLGDNADGGGDYSFANVGDGEAWGLEFDVSTPLGFVGLPNTAVFGNYARLYSEKVDTFSGLDEVRIDRQPVFVYNVGLTHVFPQWDLSFGVSYQKQGKFYQYLLNEIEVGTVSGNLEVFLEKRFLEQKLIARITGNNLLDASTFQTEELFDGPISDRENDGYEIEHEESTPVILFTLRYNF